MRVDGRSGGSESSQEGWADSEKDAGLHSQALVRVLLALRFKSFGPDVVLARWAGAGLVGEDFSVEPMGVWGLEGGRGNGRPDPDFPRLLEFGRFAVKAAARRQRRGLGKPETRAFLGFTHIAGKSRRASLPAPAQITGRPHAGQTQGDQCLPAGTHA